MWRTGAAAIAARNLNVTEATARETKSQGDQVAWHPRLLNRGKTNRPKNARPGPRDFPEASTRGSSHSNQEENQPTLRKEGPASRDLGSRNRKTERFSIPMLSEEWRPTPPVEQKMAQKRRKGTTVKPAPTTRNGQEPVYSHNLQENSQARFRQLDTTVARRNRPVKSRRGLQQAPRGRGKRRPAQARRNHHAKESLEEARIDRKEIPVDAQGIKSTRVAAARHSRRRGRQATTHNHVWPICSRGRPQSPARMPEREQSPAEAGRNTLRCLQWRSDQQWEEENPLELPWKIPRKNERISVAGAQSKQGTNRGPQVARTRNTAPHADAQRTTRSSGRHALSRPPAGRTGHGSDKEAQMPDEAVEAAPKGADSPSKAEGYSRTPAPDAEATAATLLYDRS